jgi:hypothetical protein
MNAILLVAASLVAGQADAEATAQKQRDWLLARLIDHHGFDAQKTEEVKKMLEGLTDSQVGALVDLYKEKQRQARRKQEAYEKELLNEAKRNLQRAKDYRDYLQRQYERRLVEKQQEIEALGRMQISVGFWYPPLGHAPWYGWHPPVPYWAPYPPPYHPW